MCILSHLTRKLVRMDIMQVLGPNSGMTLFKGSSRRCQLARSVAEVCVSEMLARQEFVHWVDGACRIDPSRLIPLLSKRSDDIRGCLSRMLVSRGFTLHQFLQQIERLPNEVALTNLKFSCCNRWNIADARR